MGAVLVTLVTGQLVAGGLLVAGLRVPPALAAPVLLAAISPTVVAALTLRPRAPGLVTTADLLTMLRLLGAGVLAATTVLALVGAVTPRSWLLVVLIGATLATDAVDGPIARRSRTAGPVGARIDMEADAAVVLVLSVLAASIVGPWALAIGVMRYAYVAASRIRPALRRPLPYSLVRRVIGATQGVALLTTVVPVIPVPAAGVIVSAALALLAFSFGRDVIDQERAEARGEE